MKLLIILAFLTIANGVELDDEDSILKELESLLQNEMNAEGVHEKSDAKKLETLLQNQMKTQDVQEKSDAKEQEDELEKLRDLDELLLAESDESVHLPVKKESELASDDDDFMDVVSALEQRGLRKRKRKQRKYLGDNECYDKLRSCQTKTFKARCGHWWFKKQCQFSCRQCKPKNCKDSIFGCCIGSKVAADGRFQKGCEAKLCYNLKDRCTKADCRTPQKKNCLHYCGLCKQPAPQRCNLRIGYGCCSLNVEEVAYGQKQGCPAVKIFDLRRVSRPRCRDIGYGCCRADGSKTALGPKRGCVPCKDLGKNLCDRNKPWISECLYPYTRYRNTIHTARQLCPQACGVCSYT